MFLRILEITFVGGILIYAIVKLIEMFAGNKENKSAKKAKSLSNLEKQAKKVATEKETILQETQKNKEVIDNINNTLNN